MVGLEPRGTLYPQKLTLTSPTSGGRPVGIVRSWTQATELVFFFCSWGDHILSGATLIQLKHSVMVFFFSGSEFVPNGLELELA
jgi:hypothetical protein